MTWIRGGVLALALCAAPAAAQPAEPQPATEPEPVPEDPAVVAARAAFVEGSELAKQSYWTEALGAFERSAKLRPHPVTSYNIGLCQRAIGQFLRARATLLRALADDAAGGGLLLPESLALEAQALVAEVDGLVARLTVEIDPPTAAIAVDGRPLQRQIPPTDPPTFLAGLRPPGKGKRAPAPRFVVLLEPGAHVFTVSRKGYADVVVSKDLAAGSADSLELKLDKLPARIAITSDEPAAAVHISGIDAGVVPLSVERPAGSYDISVLKEGFIPYQSRITVKAGEEFQVRADLELVTPQLYERWWFWASATAAVATVVVTTVVVALPAPERPDVDGGGLGWAVRLD